MEETKMLREFGTTMVYHASLVYPLLGNGITGKELVFTYEKVPPSQCVDTCPRISLSFHPVTGRFFFFYYQWGKRGSVRFHWSNIMGLGPLEINFIFFVEDVEECAVLVNKIDITVVNLFRNAQPPPLADLFFSRKRVLFKICPNHSSVQSVVISVAKEKRTMISSLPSLTKFFSSNFFFTRNLFSWRETYWKLKIYICPVPYRGGGKKTRCSRPIFANRFVK